MGIGPPHLAWECWQFGLKMRLTLHDSLVAVCGFLLLIAVFVQQSHFLLFWRGQETLDFQWIVVTLARNRLFWCALLAHWFSSSAAGCQNRATVALFTSWAVYKIDWFLANCHHSRTESFFLGFFVGVLIVCVRCRVSKPCNWRTFLCFGRCLETFEF